MDSIVGGGGLIQLPALLANFSSSPPSLLLGTNKLGSIFGTTSAVARYARFVRVPWRALMPALPFALTGALCGASIVSRVPITAYRPLIPAMLTLVLGYVLWNKQLGAVHAPVPMTPRRRWLARAGIAGIGFYDGFFGPGTGSFLMLLFMRGFGFDFLNASAAARLINVATNAGALIFFGLHRDVGWMLGLALGVFNASGSVLGTRCVRMHGVGLVRSAFILVVIVLIVKTGWDAR